MPTIHTRPSQSQQYSTFIAGDNHYVLFCKISFHTDPVNLFSFSLDVSAEKVLLLGFTPYYLFWALCYNFNVPYMLQQLRLQPAKCMAAQGTASNHNLLYSDLLTSTTDD